MSVVISLIFLVVLLGVWIFYYRRRNKKIVKTSNPSIGLYAICYADNIPVPEGFVAYDCRTHPHEDEREVFHMVDFYRNGMHLKHDITALLSPEYTNKTYVKGFQVAGFISDNPGFDLYLLDPFRFIHTYSYFNVWEQVESWCPGFIEITNQLLVASGYSFNVSNFPRQTFHCVGYCNYWAANKKFWDSYMDFIHPMIETLKKDKETNRIFYRYVVPWRNREISVIPFILERMLSTFLTFNPNIKVINCGRGLDIPEEIVQVMKKIDRYDEDERYDKSFHDLQSIVRGKYK